MKDNFSIFYKTIIIQVTSCRRSLALLTFAVLTMAVVLGTMPVSASPRMHDLDIHVTLFNNGDARITERRVMTIDSEGTECYIGLANMGDSQVNNLEVSDETGRAFENIGEWDIDRSREWKAGKCGIVTKDSGYELCWGLGQTGSREYVTSYTITGLVRTYPDADAIRHVFLDRAVNPKPEHARVTIVRADSVPLTSNDDSVGIWGFRYYGTIDFIDGAIVAETSDRMSSEAAIYIMVSFKKGMFNPWLQEEDTFEHKKEQALEGSDYESSSDDDFSLFDVFVAIFIFISPVFFWLYEAYKVWKARRKINKDLMWYRDIPLNGNLKEANNIVKVYDYFKKSNSNNLLSACILRLISLKAIGIEQRVNVKGKPVSLFVIREFKDSDKHDVMLNTLYRIFKNAAGRDYILEPAELRQYMRSHQTKSNMESLLSQLKLKKSLSDYENCQEEVRQVLGLRKFLKEFSLLDERHVGELALWKEYMIYATLFGIAKEVIRDMKKINPEYFKMDQIAAQMADDITLPMIGTVLHSGMASAAAEKAARMARASGHGGHSSWGGGGGGFSGGGGGGGVR